MQSRIVPFICQQGSDVLMGEVCGYQLQDYGCYTIIVNGQIIEAHAIKSGSAILWEAVKDTDVEKVARIGAVVESRLA